MRLIVLAMRTRARVDPVVVTAAFYLAAIVNMAHPVVRLTSDAANCVAFAAIQVLPGRLRVAGRTGNSAARKFALLVGTVFWIPAYIMGCNASACVVFTGPDSRMFYRLHTESADAGTVVVYRENFGALDGFSITVRQECSLLPGAVLARTLTSAAATSDAAIDIRSNGDVEILMPEGDPDFVGPALRVAHLRRFCWGPLR